MTQERQAHVTGEASRKNNGIPAVHGVNRACVEASAGNNSLLFGFRSGLILAAVAFGESFLALNISTDL